MLGVAYHAGLHTWVWVLGRGHKPWEVITNFAALSRWPSMAKHAQGTWEQQRNFLGSEKRDFPSNALRNLRRKKACRVRR